MKKNLISIVISLVVAILGNMVSGGADEEVSNRVYVKSSEYGSMYAKCIPEEHYGSKGKTLVYVVKQDNDELVQTYDWFSTQIFIMDNGASLVRLGPWQRGHEAQDDHLAIAFYKEGKLLKEYSTLDIVDKPDNVAQSISHYTVFKDILGYRWINHNDYVFEVKTEDGRLLSFNANTGELFTAEDQYRSDLIKKIEDLKGKWFFEKKDSVKDGYNYPLTEKELRDFAPQDFPALPAGYTVTVGNLFDPVQLQKINE